MGNGEWSDWARPDDFIALTIDHLPFKRWRPHGQHKSDPL